MPGHLFTQYFLTNGIRATPERHSQRPAFMTFRDEARRLFQDFAAYHNLNETQTEQDLIRPLLELLGWTDDLPQQTSSGGEDIPDLLLFDDAEAKTRASASQASPYLEALAVAELKSFRRPSTPAAQARAPRPPHPTPRFFATSPPPTSSPTASSARTSSPTVPSGTVSPQPPPRRPLLPPLRDPPGRRRLHPLHLPHHPTPSPSRLQPLPRQRPHPRLHERPRRRRHRRPCKSVSTIICITSTLLQDTFSLRPRSRTSDPLSQERRYQIPAIQTPPDRCPLEKTASA